MFYDNLIKVRGLADLVIHDDVIEWKGIHCYWPFVWGIRRSPVTGQFPLQRLVTRSFDASFDLRLNKRRSK